MTTRIPLAASLALFAILAAPLAHAQTQDPNAPATKGARGGNGGGSGGPGGPGGPGGFGGPGGWGGGPGGRGNQGPSNESAERLLQIEAVQDDLKVDDKVKAKIKTIGEEAVKERAKRRDTVTKMAEAEAAEVAARENAAMAERLAANGIEVDPRTLNNNGGGRGGRGGPGGGANNQYARQMINLAMSAFQDMVDAKLLKLLDKKQVARLKQIQLQQEGTRAFTDPNPDVVDKLAVTDEQLEEIRTVTGELRATQRQAGFDLMMSFIPADTAANNNNGGGGRGGRNFPNLANLDPEVRAKFEQANQEFQTKSTSATMAAIGKVLSTSQKNNYKKMIGEPFDVSKLRNGPGGPPPATTAATPATKPAEAAATKSADAAATKTADPAETKSATKSATGARKSLRDARGGN